MKHMKLKCVTQVNHGFCGNMVNSRRTCIHCYIKRNSTNLHGTPNHTPGTLLVSLKHLPLLLAESDSVTTVLALYRGDGESFEGAVL